MQEMRHQVALINDSVSGSLRSIVSSL